MYIQSNMFHEYFSGVSQAVMNDDRNSKVIESLFSWNGRPGVGGALPRHDL